MISKDYASTVARRAIDALFLFNPLGTAIGILVGVVLDGTRTALLPAFAHAQSVIDLSRLRAWHSIALAVVLVNLPNFIAGRRELPPEVEEAFEVIKRLEGKVPPQQIKWQYVKLCAAVVARVEVAQKRGTPPVASA
jgi:hypothetical protein